MDLLNRLQIAAPHLDLQQSEIAAPAVEVLLTDIEAFRTDGGF